MESSRGTARNGGGLHSLGEVAIAPAPALDKEEAAEAEVGEEEEEEPFPSARAPKAKRAVRVPEGRSLASLGLAQR